MTESREARVREGTVRPGAQWERGIGCLNRLSFWVYTGSDSSYNSLLILVEGLRAARERPCQEAVVA